jgi:alpha-L-fucosidase
LRHLPIAAAAAVAALSGAAAGAPPESPAERDARMAWWREAKFGMFVHWGVYSVPAGEYRGKPVSGPFAQFSEWLMFTVQMPVAEYRAYAKEFDPVAFDARAWARAAKGAGMKYIVATAKHHDGFAMFATRASDWNIRDATPYGKDPLADLASACREADIKLGFYYSHAQDWCNGGSVWGDYDGATLRPGKPWDPAQGRDMDRYIGSVALPQVRELLTGYGPGVPAVIWWDTAFDITPARAERFRRAVNELAPRAITNDRLGGGVPGDTQTPENTIPPRGIPGRDWETCMTMNDSWGFRRGDDRWKSGETLIRNLCDIASKGGNFLLNIGPTAEGRIPQASLDRLAEIGRWMEVNGEAIYGSGPTPFGDEAGAFDPSRRDAKGEPKFVPAWEWRCTTKPGKLYLILFRWPADGNFHLPATARPPTRAYLLAGRTPVPVTTAAEGITLSLPAQPTDRIASVICIETAAEPDRPSGAPSPR